MVLSKDAALHLYRSYLHHTFRVGTHSTQQKQQLVAPLNQQVAHLLSMDDYSTSSAKRNLPVSPCPTKLRLFENKFALTLLNS